MASQSQPISRLCHEPTKPYAGYLLMSYLKPLSVPAHIMTLYPLTVLPTWTCIACMRPPCPQNLLCYYNVDALLQYSVQNKTALAHRPRDNKTEHRRFSTGTELLFKYLVYQNCYNLNNKPRTKFIY